MELIIKEAKSLKEKKMKKINIESDKRRPLKN